MKEPERHCPRCGKARKPEEHGSITQWISTCSCFTADAEPDLPPAGSVTMCQICGKRANRGRSGSFTQWVFRSDICSCEKPSLIEVATTGDDNTGSEAGQGSLLEYDPDSFEDEREIAIDPDTFPVDRYKPLAELDKGASGFVFLSRDRLLGTRVAVKCLRAMSADQLIGFQNEARATSRMSHPNIVKVLNFGASEAGAPYMVMEYINGVTLQNYVVDHGVLPIPLAIDIFTQICSALTYAHGKEIFHRDIKTSNIMLTGQDANLTAYLIDFGVAMVKHATQQPTIVQGNTVVGTPLYMPPDQAIGRTYDARSEVYALGCVIFEALTGKLPFHGETAMEIISMHASQPPPLLSAVNADESYPQELQALVSRCLAKNQEDRFQSVQELSEALAAISDLRAPPAVRDTEPTPQSNFKTKWTLPIVACLFIALLAVTTLVLQGHRQDDAKVNEERRVIKRKKKASEFNDKFIVTTDTVMTTVEAEPTITDEDLKLISDIKPAKGKLLYVNLKGATNVTGKKFKYLPADIRLLSLEQTRTTDDTLKNLRSQSKLEFLGLPRTEITKAGLKNLGALPRLVNLDIAYCPKIDDDAVKLAVSNWPGLEFFALGYTGATRECAKYLKRLTRLKTLSVNGLDFTDKEVRVLSTLPIVELGVSNTEITKESLEIMAHMPKLRGLGLMNCLRISEPDRQQFQNRRPDIAIRGKPKEEVVDFFFSNE